MIRDNLITENNNLRPRPPARRRALRGAPGSSFRATTPTWSKKTKSPTTPATACSRSSTRTRSRRKQESRSTSRTPGTRSRTTRSPATAPLGKGPQFEGDIGVRGWRVRRERIDEQLRQRQHRSTTHVPREHRRNVGLPERRRPRTRAAKLNRSSNTCSSCRRNSEHRHAGRAAGAGAAGNDAQPVPRSSDQPAMPVGLVGPPATRHDRHRRSRRGAAVLFFVRCARGGARPRSPGRCARREALPALLEVAVVVEARRGRGEQHHDPLRAVQLAGEGDGPLRGPAASIARAGRDPARPRPRRRTRARWSGRRSRRRPLRASARPSAA